MMPVLTIVTFQILDILTINISRGRLAQSGFNQVTLKASILFYGPSHDYLCQVRFFLNLTLLIEI